MNEPSKKSDVVKPAAVLAAPAPPKPVATVSAPPVAAPASQPMSPFGGHRGGNKKRDDGLVAGSPEAKEADRKRDAARKAEKRSAEKMAALPAALPGVAAAPANAPVPPAAGVAGVSAVVAPAGVVAPAPTFVAWTEKFLSRPIKLLTKICDRVRCSTLMMRVRKLGLSKDQEKEIEGDIKYKQEVVDDFNASLTTCLTVELNKRMVRGAEHSHWLDVVMTGGELVMIHMNTVDKLEKMIAENDLKKKTAGDAANN